MPARYRAFTAATVVSCYLSGPALAQETSVSWTSHTEGVASTLVHDESSEYFEGLRYAVRCTQGSSTVQVREYEPKQAVGPWTRTFPADDVTYHRGCDAICIADVRARYGEQGADTVRSMTPKGFIKGHAEWANLRPSLREAMRQSDAMKLPDDRRQDAFSAELRKFERACKLGH